MTPNDLIQSKEEGEKNEIRPIWYIIKSNIRKLTALFICYYNFLKKYIKEELKKINKKEDVLFF